MRGAQQRGFIGLRHWHLGDHTPTEQDDRAIASERYLGKFRSKQQHGGSRCRELPDQGVDLALCADIDAACRVEAQQSVEPAGEPPRDHYLLLVAAAQPAQFRPRTAVDLKASDRGFYAHSLRAKPDRTPIPNAAEGRQGDIFWNRPLLQEGQQSVRRHEHDTGRYGVRWVAEPQFFAVREDGAFVVAATAGDAIEQFLLPLALQRRHPQNLTRIEFERNVVDQRTAAQPAYFQRGLRIARPLARSAGRRYGRDRS